MSDNIMQLSEDLIKQDLRDLIRSSVEEPSITLTKRPMNTLKPGAQDYGQGNIPMFMWKVYI
jgi:hypothetical protein